MIDLVLFKHSNKHNSELEEHYLNYLLLAVATFAPEMTMAAAKTTSYIITLYCASGFLW